MQRRKTSLNEDQTVQSYQNIVFMALHKEAKLAQLKCNADLHHIRKTPIGSWRAWNSWNLCWLSQLQSEPEHSKGCVCRMQIDLARNFIISVHTHSNIPQNSATDVLLQTLPQLQRLIRRIYCCVTCVMQDAESLQKTHIGSDSHFRPSKSIPLDFNELTEGDNKPSMFLL